MKNIEDSYKFKVIANLSNKKQRVLESIRFEDEDQSIKIGSVLAFTGLMITTSMVQLSASKESVLYLQSGTTMLKVSLIGILILFISAIISLYGLIVSRNYSESSDVALAEFDNLVNYRYKLSKIASVFTGIGSTFILLSFFVVFLKEVIN